MKWVLVNHASPSVQKYHLVDGVEKKAELKYNLLQQSVRVSNDDSQRVFFLSEVVSGTIRPSLKTSTAWRSVK